jgi:hypothetical protein
MVMMKRIILMLLSVIMIACSPVLTSEKKNQLQKQLNEMVTTDQVAANMPKGIYKEYSGERWNSFKDSVFTTNKITAEKIFRKYGFPGYDKVGKESSSHFWLIVQHCDKFPAFQKDVLKAMDIEVKKGNANASDYAYLFDRVKINANEKQMFGTQLTYEVQTTGRAIPKIGLSDPDNVDNLRKQYGLGPLKEYLNMMTEMHYDMNREHYQKMGIMAPNLY